MLYGRAMVAIAAMVVMVARTLASRRAVAVALLVGGLHACTCQRGTPVSEPAAPSVTVVTPAAPPQTPPPPALALPALSAPIGALILADGSVVLAGLAVKDKVVRVARVDKEERVAWLTDVLPSAAWASDSELSVYPAGAGVVVAFRGRLDGGVTRQLVRLDGRGAVLGQQAGGHVACSTRVGLYWLDGRAAFVSDLGAGPKRTPLPSPLVGEPGLFCEPTRASLVLDDDGALTLSTLGDVVGPATALTSERDFDDEEREHALFQGPTGPGVLRVGAGGALSVTRSGATRKLATRLQEADDLLVVDADERTLYAVATQDHEGCPAGEDASALPTRRTSRFSTSVHLLRVDLASGETTREELGRAACGHQPGPFYLGATRGKHVLAWSERAPTGARRQRAPIAALAVRVFGATLGDTTRRRAELTADALADAGCTDAGCAAVWLERPEGQDDREPELPRVLRYAP